MKVIQRSEDISAVPRKDPRGRRRAVGWHRAAPLDPKYRRLHLELLAEGKPMSGRFGGYVYSWRKGRLHWRRHVIPRDPRTPAQRRARAALATASKAWSENTPLTEEQRDHWNAAAARTKSKPRLYQSGYLTAQQYFVGTNCRKERWGQPLLLEPSNRQRKKGERETHNGASSVCQQELHQPVPPTSETPRPSAQPTPSPRGHAKCRRGEAICSRVPIQVPLYQGVARASSECPRASTLLPPVQYRCHACPPVRFGRCLSPEFASTVATIRRNPRLLALWRGG